MDDMLYNAASNQVIDYLLSTGAGLSILTLSVIVLAANGITMLVPTQLKNEEKKLWKVVANYALKFTNILAGNILKNKNLDEKISKKKK